MEGVEEVRLCNSWRGQRRHFLPVPRAFGDCDGAGQVTSLDLIVALKDWWPQIPLWIICPLVWPFSCLPGNRSSGLEFTFKETQRLPVGCTRDICILGVLDVLVCLFDSCPYLHACPLCRPGLAVPRAGSLYDEYKIASNIPLIEDLIFKLWSFLSP